MGVNQTEKDWDNLILTLKTYNSRLPKPKRTIHYDLYKKISAKQTKSNKLYD